ncbi:hypothetical protein SEEN470_08729 [Salmonella enterica subsp. enterica serovar Newport str. CVM 19470]|nr:hypothetical protein SEEN470_08729 [Salmonella enterica subsp. enterica serovar Newport str. CVM 19470]
MCLIAFLVGKKALHLFFRKKYFIINDINK